MLEEDSRKGLVPYEYVDPCSGNKKKRPAVRIVDGLVKVPCLPAKDEFTVRITKTEDDMVWVGNYEVLRLGGHLEPYNASDLATGGAVLGTFGERSGGVPEVRICLSSEAPDSVVAGGGRKPRRADVERLTADDRCATWGVPVGDGYDRRQGGHGPGLRTHAEGDHGSRGRRPLGDGDERFDRVLHLP